MNRSAPLLLIAFLAMSALRLPSVSGQMTIPQGIEAVYDNKSGGSRGSKRNVFRKSRSGSSSSWSKKKRKSHSSSSSSSSSSKSKSKSSYKSKSRYKSQSKSSDKSSKSYTKKKRSGGSKHKDSSSSESRSDTTKDSSKSKKKSGGSKHKDTNSKTRGNNGTKKSYSRDKKSNKDEDKTKTSKTTDKKSTSEGKEKVSTWKYITATSGDSGFDENTNDFDILRDLITTVDFVELLSDPDDGGLDVITFFAPWDLAFSKLADRLGYDGDYDEEAIFAFLAAAIETFAEGKGTTQTEAIKDILRYHIGEPQRTEERLREKGTITTTYEDLKLDVEVIKKGDRTMLIDESGTNPKLHDKLKDIKTTNGLFHYIKSVLLPYDDIYGDASVTDETDVVTVTSDSDDATVETDIVTADSDDVGGTSR